MAYMRNQLLAKKYSVTKWRELIDDWIFSAVHRDMVKAWLVDDLTVAEVAEKFCVSDRTASKVIASAFLQLIDL